MTVQVMKFEKKDRLAELMKVMNIIQSGFGIKTDIQQAKILREKHRQEKLKADEDELAVKRRKEGKFNQPEYDKLFTQDVTPETPGAVHGWIDESVTNKYTGLRENNPDGTPKIKTRMFWYVPEGNLLGTERQYKNTEAKSKENQIIAIDKGYLTPSLLLNRDLVGDYSYEDKSGEGYREGKLFVNNREEKPVWYLTPQEYKAKLEGEQYIREQDALDKKLADPNSMESAKLKGAQLDVKLKEKALSTRPPGKVAKSWQESSPGIWQGVQAAKQAGIANPTLQDAEDYHPANINKGVEKLSDDIRTSKIAQLVDALSDIHRLIDLDSDKEVPGVDFKSRAASNLPFGAGNLVMSKGEADVNNSLDNVIRAYRNFTSGAAISATESGPVMDALGAKLFTTPEVLRGGLRRVRNQLLRELRSIEAQASLPALRKYRERNGSVRSDIDLFKNADFEKKNRPPAASDEEAIDRELEGQ